MSRSEGNRVTKLYNGMTLPADWPPRYSDDGARSPRVVPYLENPPSVIPIDVGRQLFVDDFLVEQSDLVRRFHYPRPFDANPVLRPETPVEMNNGFCPVACPFTDGVFYDSNDRLFKMWYHAGWFGGTALAISKDGIQWERPNWGVEPDTNLVLPRRNDYFRDGVGVWLDHDAANPNERYKMFIYHRHRDRDAKTHWEGGLASTSADGIHWGNFTPTGPCGDNTTFFYNPFRKRWVYSIRTTKKGVGRLRGYREHEDFIAGAEWGLDDVVHWTGADDLDAPDPALEYPTQLYNVDAVGYESILLGLFMIHRGPPNNVCETGGFPKITEVVTAYSRDGFHWHRPDREAFIPCSREEGSWNRGYIHTAGGCCVVVGDQLYFYFGAFSGISPRLGTHMYAGGSTGLAVLRRDGFASLDADGLGGSITTRTVTFQGRYLFVNCDTSRGDLRVEVLDRNGRVIAPFARESCIPVRADSTMKRIEWSEAQDLSRLAGEPVKLKFSLSGGRLYSFWVSRDLSGASFGYMGAGGPGIPGVVDTVGAYTTRG